MKDKKGKQPAASNTENDQETSDDKTRGGKKATPRKRKATSPLSSVKSTNDDAGPADNVDDTQDELDALLPGKKSADNRSWFYRSFFPGDTISVKDRDEVAQQLNNYRNKYLSILFMLTFSSCTLGAGLQFFRGEPSDKEIIATACDLPSNFTSPEDPCAVDIALLRQSSYFVVQKSADTIALAIANILRIDSISIELYFALICATAGTSLIAEFALMHHEIMERRQKLGNSSRKAIGYVIGKHPDGEDRKLTAVMFPGFVLASGALLFEASLQVAESLFATSPAACFNTESPMPIIYTPTICIGGAIERAFNVILRNLSNNHFWLIVGASGLTVPILLLLYFCRKSAYSVYSARPFR